jgi:hypothetical protein
MSLQMAYAYRRGIFRDDARDLARHRWAPGAFAATIVFLVSIPVALLSPLAGMLTWILATSVGDRLGEPFAARALGD